MTNEGPLATSTSNLLDTELTISGLLKQMNGGYLRYASEYWVDNSNINDTVCLKYVITPQDANYLAIDSLTFYAKTHFFHTPKASGPAPGAFFFIPFAPHTPHATR